MNTNHEAWMNWLVARGVLTQEKADDTLRRIRAGEDVRIPIARVRRVDGELKAQVAGDGTAVKFKEETS